MLVTHHTQKYEHTELDNSSIAIAKEAIPQTCQTVYTEHLECPITYDDILTALRAGARHKAPGLMDWAWNSRARTERQ
jgi:hypothetical protein